jgi:hypothetical protein
MGASYLILPVRKGSYFGRVVQANKAEFLVALASIFLAA